MAETEPAGRSLQGTFTDYVFSIETSYLPHVWDYLENDVLPELQRVAGLDVGMASHECNDEGDTYHSLLARNETLAQRLEDLLAERADLLARCEAQAKALRNEFDRG